MLVISLWMFLEELILPKSAILSKPKHLEEKKPGATKLRTAS